MSLKNTSGKNAEKPGLPLLPFCLSAVIICACGGGGSGSETDTPAPAPAAVEPETSLDPIAELNTLVIAEDFSFTSKQEVTFTVSLPAYTGERVYVALYGNYRQLPSGEYYPIPESRILAGNMEQGQFRQLFTSLGGQQNYLAEIWLYDLSPPLQKELVLNDNTLDW